MPIGENDPRRVTVTPTPNHHLAMVQPNNPRMMDAHVPCLAPCMMHGTAAAPLAPLAVVSIERRRSIVGITHIDPEAKPFGRGGCRQREAGSAQDKGGGKECLREITRHSSFPIGSIGCTTDPARRRLNLGRRIR